MNYGQPGRDPKTWQNANQAHAATRVRQKQSFFLPGLSKVPIQIHNNGEILVSGRVRLSAGQSGVRIERFNKQQFDTLELIPGRCGKGVPSLVFANGVDTVANLK